MSGETGRITEITEEELTRTYKHGIAVGLEMAQKTMLERAGLDFCAGNDKQANCLRAWSNVFKNMAEKERPEPIKEQA